VIGFIKKIFGPSNCDDAKLAERTVRAAKANDITNFYGCCGSWSAMASVPALLCMFIGLPGIIPFALFAGGLAVLGSAIPMIKLTEKIENAFTTECKSRKVCPPGWDRDYFLPPEPKNDNNPQIPVLTDIFDPQAAITLGEKIAVGRTLKLKRKPHAFRKS
jgi:hypothetical protein